jgi:Cof subfamily protein (haloacid dehalogenase superfamily)
MRLEKNDFKSRRGMMVTDLDGTLLTSERTVSDADLETLRELGRQGIPRVIATGRSLFSFKRTEGLQLPIDYVIFSTGAGILRVSDGHIFRDINLDPEMVSLAMDALRKASLDFMVHLPVPDNHRFSYRCGKVENHDFTRRIELYKDVCRPLDGNGEAFGPAAQLLAIVPPSKSLQVIEDLRKNLPALNVIRTTSPLDGKSTWIEIFHRNVSKGLAAEWLSAELGIPKRLTLSVGNDFNDLDLLDWAGTSFVVGNAPDVLKEKYAAVASHNHNGVTEAVSRWLENLE